MIVCKEHEFIFVHVPNSGGTSIRQCLLEQGVVTFDEYKAWKNTTKIARHSTLEQIYAAHPKAVRDYFVFGVVRNPWAALVSFYYHKKLRGAEDKDNHPKSLMWHNKLKDTTFESWVMSGEGLRSCPSQQKYFLKAGISYLLRFEELDEAFPAMMRDEFNIDITMNKSHPGSGSGRDYKKEFTPEMLKKVEPAYKWEIDTLGYTF